MVQFDYEISTSRATKPITTSAPAAASSATFHGTVTIERRPIPPSCCPRILSTSRLVKWNAFPGDSYLVREAWITICVPGASQVAVLAPLTRAFVG